jgi:hypothetical protein
LHCRRQPSLFLAVLPKILWLWILCCQVVAVVAVKVLTLQQVAAAAVQAVL